MKSKSVEMHNNTDAEILSWLVEKERQIQEETDVNTILALYREFINLNIFDTNFVKHMCAALTKILPECAYTNLADIVLGLKKLNHNQDIGFIQSIVSNICTKIKDGSPNNYQSSINIIWSLSKLNFFDQGTSELLLDDIFKNIHKVDIVELNKITQAIANFRIINETQLGQLIDQIDKQSDLKISERVNIALHLRKISLCAPINNNQIVESSIKKLMDNIEYDERMEESLLHQLLLISISGTESGFKSFSNYAAPTCPSKIQENVVQYIKKACPKFQLTKEYYNIATGSHTDLLVQRDLNDNILDLYVEIDGPTHYFRNHNPKNRPDDPRYNGSTIFRNKLYEIHNQKLHIIPYTNIDKKDYHAKLLEALNQDIELKDDHNANVKTSYEIQLSANPDNNLSKNKPKAKAKSSKNKSNTKAKNHDEVTSEDFHDLLQEFKDIAPPMESIESQFKMLCSQYGNINTKRHNKTKHITLTPLKLLEQIITKKNLQDLQTAVEYYLSEKPSLDYGHVFESCISRLSLDNIGNTKIYLGVADKILSSGYEPSPLTADIIKSLIYAFYHSEVSIFHSFLKLLPINHYTQQLKECFLINCGFTNNVDTARFLLNEEVDINSCYSRISLEMILGVGTGKYHSGSEALESQIRYTIHELYEYIFSPNESTADTVESILETERTQNRDKQPDNSYNQENRSTGMGLTALHAACYVYQNTDMVRFLLNEGANPNSINGVGATPIISAIINGSEDSALEILKYDPNIAIALRGNITITHMASATGLNKLIAELAKLNKLDYLATTDIKTTFGVGYEKTEVAFTQGEVPLVKALQYRHVEIAKILIQGMHKEALDSLIIPEGGPNNVIYTDKIAAQKNPVLHYCITYYPELIDLLLEKAVDLNQVNDNNNNGTPLMCAAEYSNISTLRKYSQITPPDTTTYNKLKSNFIFEKLLISGANINLTDSQGDKAQIYTQEEEVVSVHSTILVNLEAYNITAPNDVYNMIIRVYEQTTTEEEVQPLKDWWQARDNRLSEGRELPSNYNEKSPDEGLGITYDDSEMQEIGIVGVEAESLNII